MNIQFKLDENKPDEKTAAENTRYLKYKKKLIQKQIYMIGIKHSIKTLEEKK